MLRTTRSATLALAAAGLLVVGCGSGDDDGDGVASVSGDDGESAEVDEAAAQEDELLDWVECMRDEGIDLPDPTRDADGNLVVDGNGIHIGGGPGRASGRAGPDDPSEDEPPFSREEMDAATEACGAPPLLGPGDMSDEDRQDMQDAALEFAECMRDEGIEDFPDPDFSDEGPGGEASSSDSDEGDEGDEGDGPTIRGPFGEIDMGDPEVEAAFEACQDVLGDFGAAGGSSGPGGDAERSA